MSILSPAFRARTSWMPKWMPPSDCKLWLPGQDDPQSATIRDRSGSGNNGTITGATWTQTGQGLWYLDFDAATENVDCGTTGLLTPTSGTVLIWAKSPLTADDNMLLSASDKDTQAADEWQFNWRGGANKNIRFITRTLSANVQELTTPTDSLVANTWTLCGVVSSGTAISMFINGVSQTITVVAGVNNGDWFGDVPNLDNITIGLLIRQVGNVAPFVGGIALVRILNVALTATQILGIFNQERHMFGV